MEWFSWYDVTNDQPGNLAMSTNLTVLDGYFNDSGKRALWDVGDGMCGQASYCGGTASANDSTPCGDLWGEPFCGGAYGPTADYLTEVDKVVAAVAGRPHVTGLFLGDEGMLLGVDVDSFCRLANATKAALAAAGRGDIFVYWVSWLVS